LTGAAFAGEAPELDAAGADEPNNF